PTQVGRHRLRVPRHGGDRLVAGGFHGSRSAGDSRARIRPRCCPRAPRCSVGLTTTRTFVRGGYLKMLTARAATRSTVIAEIADSESISSFAQRLSGIASVGLKAIELVNET